MTKKKEIRMSEIKLEDFDSMEEKLDTVMSAKIESDKDSINSKRPSPGRKRSGVTEDFKDPEFVKTRTVDNISELTRYQLYRLNKHRTQLGLAVFDRRKIEKE